MIIKKLSEIRIEVIFETEDDKFVKYQNVYKHPTDPTTKHNGPLGIFKNEEILDLKIRSMAASMYDQVNKI